MTDYARYIDHTLLAANATEQQIATLCDEAIAHRFMPSVLTQVTFL